MATQVSKVMEIRSSLLILALLASIKLTAQMPNLSGLNFSYEVFD